MSAIRAISIGVRGALGSWRLALGLWLVNVALTLPLAWAMAERLREAIGASLVHEGLRSGFDTGWFGELQADASGLVTSFTPTVVGVGALYDNLEAWLNGGLFRALPLLVGLGIVYALLWAFLLGGVLARFARPEMNATLSAFVSSGARYFPRFVALAALSGVLYYLVYRFQRWLFLAVEDATLDVTVERRVLSFVLLAAALVVFLLCLISMTFDYAKIASVLDPQAGLKDALRQGIHFVFGHPLKTLGVYYGVAAVGAASLGLYALFAPGAGQATGLTVVLAFLVGQAYLVVKLLLRLALLKGEMSLFQAIAVPMAPSTTEIGEEPLAIEAT